MIVTIRKITERMRRDGFIQATGHICQVGAQRAVNLPLRLKKQRDLVTNLPGRLDMVKNAYAENPQTYLSAVRKRTLAYVESNHREDINMGAYSYKTGGPPILYASCYAVLTRDLYGDLADLSESQRQNWISYIQAYQKDDGLFRDPVIDTPLADEIDWWGWRHLTLHVLMAMTALGGKVEKPFVFIKPFRKKGYMTTWLDTRNWKLDPASVSNEVQNYATVIQYARNFQHEDWCGDALKEMYDWLDKTQDPETGLWGNRYDDPVLLSNGVQTGYHLWLLYFYDRRPIQYQERIIDSCLKTQNRFGGFGVPLNSSACEDIDSIDPLVRFSSMTDYRRADVLAALQEALPWILVNMNADGGWVFRRYEAFQYGHQTMKATREESAMFPSWFRSLTLAYLAKVLEGSVMPNGHWRFLEGPGHQFWIVP